MPVWPDRSLHSGRITCLPLGQRDGLRKLAANRFRRDSFYSDDGDCQRQASLHNDPGYAAQHPDECGGRVGFYSVLRVDDVTSRGRWRTPSLRDVALTAPYMHDGLYDTLEDVVWHYSDGARGLPPLHLDGAEVSDLVAFLRSLTGAALPAELTHAPALPPKSPF